MLSNIPEAFGKLLLDSLGLTNYKEDPKSVERLNECFKCELGGKNSPLSWDKFCGDCGCYMPGKVLVKNERCPQGKWQ